MSVIRVLAWTLAAGLLLGGCSKDNVRNSNASPDKLAEVNVQLGIGYMRNGNLDTAMKKLQEAVSLDDSYAPAHDALGVLYERLGENAKAARHFARAVSLDPKNSGTLSNYGQFLCQNGQPEKAQELFKKAVSNPLYASPEVPYTNAGLCALSQKDPKAAETYFRSALTRNPKFAPALYEMADLSYEQHHYLSAKGYLQRYLDITKPSAESLWLGIRIERQLGNQNAVSSYAMLLKNKFPDSEETRALIESEKQ
jgi:type IV pilus assembly protein PilF